MFSLLIFHQFFQGDQLTPFAPMCGCPCTLCTRFLPELLSRSEAREQDEGECVWSGL